MTDRDFVREVRARLVRPKAAAKAGIPFPELCSRILEDARCG